MKTSRNARFWQWLNGGWVKITLRPGQTLTHATGGETEEGWSFEGRNWHHDGDAITSTVSQESLDCDGRFDASFAFKCPLGDLRARDMHAEEQERAVAQEKDPTLPYFNESIGIFAPDWERLNASQRDHEAERAGY